MSDPITLGKLAAIAAGDLRGDPDLTISDVTHDSREVKPGSLFVAVRGFSTDGHDFVSALPAGSAATVESWVAAGIPQIRVADSRAAMGPLADTVHGHPSRELTVIGVTGTNGKTTITYLIEAIVQAAGGRPGRVGTTGASIAGTPIPVARTTPEASDLHRLLRQMAEEKVTAVGIEVSSHALTLGRVGGVDFDVAAFTNLTQDHLDFHADMEDYFAAKGRLFDGRARHEVIWIDDPYGERLYTTRLGYGALAVGFATGDVHASDIRSTLARSSFTVHSPQGSVPVELSLGGRFNVANALVAAAAALAAGLDLGSIAKGLSDVERIPGRMEPVEQGQPFTVIVDYAHSPGGVEIVVEAARPLTPGRLVAVIGAGGDRDREKRPRMGAAAAGADLLVVTSDNPRSEDPEAIIDEVMEGAVGGRAAVVREADRRRAIALALEKARPGDTVLILGKGHEPGQEIGGVVHPFDDRAEARRILAAMGFEA